MQWYEQLDVTFIIIVVGSLIGSIKANLYHKDKGSLINQAINIIIGWLVGIFTAGYYSNNYTFWLTSLIAITVSMLAVAILETLYSIAPAISKMIIKFYMKTMGL